MKAEGFSVATQGDSATMTSMVQRRVGVVVLAAALVLSGCTGSTDWSIAPAGSCDRSLTLDGTHYVPGDAITTVRQGEPVVGATIRDECQGTDAPAEPVAAWRAMGFNGDGIVTTGVCFDAAIGRASGQACGPDYPRFDLWVPYTSTP